MRDSKDVTLLIVDDEVVLTKAIAYDFKRRGYRTFCAHNGREAFDIVRNEKIDVVVTDVRMPDGDGIELLDLIKAYNHELPVVLFITGFSDLSLEEAYHQGADAVFTKPFDRHELFAAVNKAVMSKDEAWSMPADGLETKCNVHLYFPELNLAIEKKSVLFGRGGFFVGLEEDLPPINTAVEFHLEFEDENKKELNGKGLVRWARYETAPKMPRGIGIEFAYLADDSRQWVIDFIRDLRTRSYIPRI